MESIVPRFLVDGDTTSYLVLSVSIPGIIYLCYRWALPKPIPGIPYNKDAVKSIFGDATSMVEYTSKTQEMYAWMVEQNIKLQSPVVQVFVRPLSNPWIVVSDFRESYDCLVRRTKDFDKSVWFKDVAGGVMPESHIFMRTTPRFKQHRRLIQDIMSPVFLNNVAAMHIHNVCQDVIHVWEQKARLASGHAFSVIKDVHYAALDAIWALIFGDDSANSTTKAQLDLFLTMEKIALPGNSNSPVELPRADSPLTVQSVMTLTQSIEASLKSPMPALAHWMYRQTSAMKRAFKIKEEFIKREVNDAERRFDTKTDVQCAVDNFLRREAVAAEKEGRQRNFHSRDIYDEILGLLIAAHDTTSTSILWALKFMADHQDVQKKLRKALHTAHSNAVSEKRLPTYQEILNSPVHYRDAVVEEIFRCSLTEAAVTRTSIRDTEILGHFVPKDTEVFFMCNGPSIFSAAFPIDDAVRSTSSQEGKDQACHWDPTKMAVFDPERWLIEENGQIIFDHSAGPLLIFSLGERGCYGRKMAYVEMKIFLTLLIWSFDFQACPEELSGYGAVDKLVHAPQQCYINPIPLSRP
ncbi:uncharacterized protein TRIVIDRAFT_53690 [Trichoderma virens Gv29-8]|uniref:Cytochrome P450 n=1 Tax=Hypocrea virens (strain Gv29-8 / FGSC 10586) TaxID=413071 RepID=G9MU00_HYPVG|nr:uncharacterized protein TRIVIDRAFT_53690 [Trichoderma virens Gv29-8]EHK22077.1 hypothetical protein TRIVIDRAFT_53690 [Trichoderma virens Gv29-8]UKZ55868.1 hypothetical protein TrVGV298_009692 [Trichoderma virens]